MCRSARTMPCVSSLVLHLKQSTSAAASGRSRSTFAYEKNTGGTSDGCSSIPACLQSIVRPSSRGGVPVLRRASGRPMRSRVAAMPTVGGSTSPLSLSRTIRPAGRLSRPMWILPRRNVPAVSTTERAAIVSPLAVTTPATAPVECSARSSTAASTTRSPGHVAIACCIAALYSVRSACARGPRTAGPFERLSRRKWMPASSAHRAMSPSSASISRTRWPLPTPPMDGLHDSSPMVLACCVTRTVRAPQRAAAAAASQPA
mmetsp:Transcript_10740/g.31602  ORF Transcript_10740/g.31602 Transcript_10740/m.31602 type:complete len:260 (-) Transcript_10740:13-792(-)